MQHEIDKQEQKLIEMTQGPVAALDFALKHMESTAFETFSHITKNVEDAVKAMNESSSSLIGIQFNVFKDAGKDLDKFRLELQHTMREAEKTAAAGDTWAPYRAGIDLVQEKERELTKLIQQRTAASGADASAAVDGLHAERQAVNDMLPVLQKGLELETKRHEEMKKEKDQKAEEEAKKRARALAKIEKMQEEFDKRVTTAHQQLNKQLDKQDEERSKHVLDQLIREGKAAEKASDETLEGYIREEKGQIAALDGEMQAEQAADEQKAILLKTQYDRGLITGQQYLANLKQLYDAEMQALIAILTRKQQLVVMEAQNEAALRGKILTDADAKELKAYIDLENQKRKISTDYTNKVLHEQDQIDKRQARSLNTVSGLLDQYSKKLRQSHGELQGWGKAADAVLTDVSEAFGSAISEWIMGNESLGAALEKALAQYLAQIAGKAAVDAMYFTAWGVADLFWHPARAGADFAAAAEFAAIAGVAGGAARALGGGSKSSAGSSGSAPQIDTSQTATHPGTSGQQQPSAVKVVPHFAGGALISTPTLAMIGDSHSGGSAREAVLPLDDSHAMDSIAGEIAGRMHASAGGVNIYVEGLISADHLNKVVKKISRGVNRGTVRLQSNRSLRVLTRG
jgi:hypothetical protein